MPDHTADRLHDRVPAPPKEMFEQTIDHAVRDIEAAAQHIHKDSDDLISRAAKSLNEAAMALATEVRKQADVVRREADKDLKAHPIAAAAAVAVAAAALAGVVVANLNHSSSSPAKPD